MHKRQKGPTNPFIEFKKEDVEGSIPARFDQMVAKYPNRLAVKDKNRELTYRELNQEANRVAHAILDQSEGGEEPVALIFDQGFQAIAAILGTLKSGKPYVFLDPALSSDRNELILTNSEARLVVSDASNFSKASSYDHLETINIDEYQNTSPRSKKLPTVSPDSPACILYTSGSTGVPKGVILSHRSQLATARNYTNCFHLSYEDRLCFLYSPSVSAAIRIILLALCNGAALCFFDLKVEGFVKLPDWLRKEKISRYFSVASVFRHFTSMLSEEDQFPDVRLVRLGGEPTLPKDVESYKKHFSKDCLFVNRIGGTETGTYSWFCLNQETQINGNTVPVGYPMEGYEVFLVDEDGNEVEEGQIGEIVLKSRYLASGFWKRPDLTEASFVPAPDGGEERIFRTGDLGRRLPDGCLIHMGRKDHQVKIRGYRIEVAEIEKVLLNLGTVKDTVVMPWKGKDGEQHLVAYFVPEADRTSSISELREELVQKLPGYMVPTYIVPLDEFPRAANGKINRGALPEPGSQRPALNTPFVAPRNPIEKKVADVWSEVLGLDEVGVDDSFLELGGNSLRATQVLSRILDGFDVELQMDTLMQAPSVGSMAELIMHQIVNKGGPEKENLESDRTISRKKEGTSYALSFGQERLWFLDQLGQTVSAYHVSHAFRMEGLLDRSALAKALEAIVARHDTIRTTFRMEGEKPVQVVDPDRTIELEEVDLRESPESTSEEEFQRLLRLETDRPFDLSRDLMLRATLYRLEDEVHVLLLVMHHIASDGWSSGILYRELSEFYAVHVTGRSPDLPELSIQYADYAEWQREWVESEKVEKQLAYWKERLAGSPAILELPTNRPRPPRQTFRGAQERGFLSEELTAALKSMSRRERCTLAMTLLAAFQTLLYRCTGQDDIVVGSPIAGRTRSEVEKLIGIFLNTLALRSDLSGNPSFSELLKRVRDVTLGAYENQDIPFEKLLEELNPPRDLSRTPLFQVFFNMMNFTNLGIEMPGLMVEEIPFSERPSKFDFTLYLKEQDGGILLDWVYNPDLFDAHTIRGFQRYYQTLLEEVIRLPDQPISTIPILRDADREQLIVEWNDTQADFPAACIHELFEAQAEKTPDAVAAIFEEEEITYRELNQRANQLAHHLQSLGIQVEDRVGIFMERSLEMVIGVLGILKTGGAYVPMDPIYPPERIGFMLEDSQASVLLTQSRMAELLPENGAKRICLDSDWEEICPESTENPNTETKPENLAYLIYTSGSTGTPKGVLGAHRATINRFSWMWQQFPFEKGEVTSQRAPLNVVAAVWEIFGPMLQGVPILIIPDEVVKDPHRLINTLASRRVTRLVVVPSLLRTILDSEPSLGSALPNLRYCSTSGEELPLSVVRQFVESVPHAKLLNLYGPTELASDVTCFEFPQNERLTSVPIGRPIANTRAYILDKNLELVPIGVPGELHFGGAGLARGYHQRSELTAEKFIQNPFDPDSKARLYKTGDLARYLPNGDIVFLGRTDNQVKVRGFRIELGEIESVLEQHEAINAVAVTEFEIAPGENSLVAYVAPNSGHSLSVDTLHSYLAQKLPRYMIPARFVFLEALPLNPYGKVDRKALPKPDRSRPEFEKSFVAPRTVVEKDLAKIWSEILKVDQVGIHDDFFELGGHSLMATRIIARIRSQIGVAIPLVSIFESSTVAEMAEAILQYKINQFGAEEIDLLLDEVETSTLKS